jgi:hypothetical protein
MSGTYNYNTVAVSATETVTIDLHRISV